MRQVAFCLVLFIAAGSAFAQVGGTGSIEGTVTDPLGAVVVDATVTAANLATGTETVRKTTEAGFFVLPLLTAGEYTVTVKAAGFETQTQAHVIVDALAIVPVNPKLKIGMSTQSITVEEQPTLLKAEDAVLGSSIENQVYDALPLAMNGAARDPSAFAGLAGMGDLIATCVSPHSRNRAVGEQLGKGRKLSDILDDRDPKPAGFIGLDRPNRSRLCDGRGAVESGRVVVTDSHCSHVASGLDREVGDALFESQRRWSGSGASGCELPDCPDAAVGPG